MRLDYIHSFRGFAILLVILGHTAVSLFDWNGQEDRLDVIGDLIDNSAVLFVFIAGFLFQLLSNEYKYFPYLKSKFLKILLPYIIVSIPAVAHAFLLGNPGLEFPQAAEHGVLYQIAWYFSVGGAHINYTLWFIPMIAIYFIAFPLFKIVVRMPFLYFLIIPLFILSNYLHRAPTPVIDPLRNALYFLPVYLLGMCCSQYKNSLTNWIEEYLVGMAIFMAVVVAAQMSFSEVHGIYYADAFSFSRGMLDWGLVQKVVLCFLMLGVLKKYSNIFDRPLGFLADRSFSIFLLHLYFVYAFNLALHWQPIEASVFIWLLVAAAILLLSLLAAWLGKITLGKYSRFIIGY